MRKDKLSIDEILEAEKAADSRRENRNKGFRKMKERDAGKAYLTNHFGDRVLMEWLAPKPQEGDYVHRPIPDNMFILNVEGKEVLLDANEVRNSLRWV